MVASFGCEQRSGRVRAEFGSAERVRHGECRLGVAGLLGRPHYTVTGKGFARAGADVAGVAGRDGVEERGDRGTVTVAVVGDAVRGARRHVNGGRGDRRVAAEVV
jgi:hypothetical protein